jgi:tetratricopeptide (TPR) repeat protein
MMKDVDVTKYLIKLAEEFIREKRYDDAILLYRKLVDMRPGEESFRLALAWAYHDTGMRKEAVECFEHLLAMELERKVFTGFAFDELVRIFKEEKDYERLVVICERVIAEHPDDIGFLGDLGDAYLKAGRAGRAVEVFEKMARMEPDSAVIFCSLGNALVAKGDFDAAEEAYQKAVEIDPSEKVTFYNRLAGIYFEAGHDQRAEKVLRKCIEYCVDEPVYYCSLGDVLVRQGRLTDAESAYEKAITLNPNDAGAYYNRFGNALAKATCHLRAIEIFKRAIAVDPRNPFYYLRLAESYTAAGLPDMAGKTYREAESLK